MQCRGGEVWRNGQCQADGATAGYALVVTLLLGLGVLILGICMWRQRGREPETPFVQGSVWHKPRLVDRVITKGAPYFLIFWGLLWLFGIIMTVADGQWRHL
jgi:hypothetical protein